MNCLIISKTGHTCQKKAIDQYHWKWHLAFWSIYYLGIHKTALEKHTVCLRILYTPVKSYVVKQPQEKWACDFHDDAPPLSFQLQVTEDFF